MFVFLYAASLQGNKRRVNGGSRHADVYCWIPGNDLAEAAAKARQAVERAGWIPDSLVDARAVERSDYEGEGQDALRYFDEACRNGETVLIWQHAEENEGICPVHDTSWRKDLLQ